MMFSQGSIESSVLHSAEPDYLDEEVHLSPESIIRREVTVPSVCKTTDRSER
jgi:hypothetical protein